MKIKTELMKIKTEQLSPTLKVPKGIPHHNHNHHHHHQNNHRHPGDSPIKGLCLQLLPLPMLSSVH